MKSVQDPTVDRNKKKKKECRHTLQKVSNLKLKDFDKINDIPNPECGVKGTMKIKPAIFQKDNDSASHPELLGNLVSLIGSSRLPIDQLKKHYRTKFKEELPIGKARLKKTLQSKFDEQFQILQTASGFWQIELKEDYHSLLQAQDSKVSALHKVEAKLNEIELKAVRANLIYMVGLCGGKIPLHQVKPKYEKAFAKTLPNGPMKLKSFLAKHFRCAFVLNSDFLELLEPFKSVPPTLLQNSECIDFLEQRANDENEKIQKLCLKLSKSRILIDELRNQIKMINVLKQKTLTVEQKLFQTRMEMHIDKITSKQQIAELQDTNRTLEKSIETLQKAKANQKIMELKKKNRNLEKRLEKLNYQCFEFEREIAEGMVKNSEEEDKLNQKVGRLKNINDILNMKIIALQAEKGNDLRCCVCLSRQKNVVLFPCKHLCVCVSCSDNPSLHGCPLCKRTISKKVFVFA
mmetsp:Transcript_27625/g.36248  ORF Transcript_27625/g.36248 Transcript_27625/m.36248 type:complete len:462 (+) Transcript_27625:156-1541(+)